MQYKEWLGRSKRYSLRLKERTPSSSLNLKYLLAVPILTFSVSFSKSLTYLPVGLGSSISCA